MFWYQNMHNFREECPWLNDIQLIGFPDYQNIYHIDGLVQGRQLHC